ncbi:MAG: hypothetical protein K0R00_3834 [Herbinix sp.]|jgi:hypothetical protein|nr:hypothetical protein [Herbinix sp.]
MFKVNNMIYLAFSAFIFCIGVYLLLNNAIEYRKTLTILRESYKEQEVLEQENRDNLDIITYGELIATLYNELDYNIKINDIVIERNSYDPEELQNYEIVNANYKKSYMYNNNGEIIFITYTEINGKE